MAKLSILASITDENSSHFLLKKIKATKTNLTARMDMDAVNDVETGVALILLRNKNLEQALQEYENRADDSLDDFLISLNTQIFDSLAAANAADMYNLNWFKSLDFSVEAKIKIAATLIAAVTNYNASYVSSLWQCIQERDADIINEIGFVFSKYSSD